MSTLPENFTATRYHSLALDPDTVPEALTVTAVSETGVIMGVKHVTLPIEGVQFHPESVLTEGGHEMLANWLTDCGFSGAREKLASIPQVTITSRV
jgi:para-aminobenzoate synthetase component 2